MHFKPSVFACVMLLSLSQAFAHDPAGWKLILPPGGPQRMMNGVQVLDENIIVAVGGYERNDSIRSIWRSTNKGQSWDILMDSVDRSWLTAVDFVDTALGFAVGYNGAVLKTTTGGVSWTNQHIPLNVIHRDFNSVFFIDAQTGFVAGGRRTNDSIQTILKTVDGGNTWSVQRDMPGHWLRSIYFTDANTGYATGDSGVVLKTTNGGANWTQLVLPGNTGQRDFNAVFFLNTNTGFLGGGNQTNDSIRTILKTTDGGNNWDIISDNLAPWIRSIYFTAPTNGFAVGDFGTILLSEDTGATWTQVAIPHTVNDSVKALRTVHFFNRDFGVTGGSFGKVLVYESVTPTLPSVITGYTTEISAGDAVLNATVNANGIAADVTFEYGTTPALGTTVTAQPSTVSGSTDVAVSAQLTGLDSNTVYYYRVKAVSDNEISLGLTRQFITGNPIPNWDFERWNDLSAYLPEQWFTIGDITQVPSYDGSFAALIAYNQFSNSSGLLHATPSEPFVVGGVPFAARPDSIIGYFKYDVAAWDSAFLFLGFKKNSVVNSQEIYYITGSSNGNFERLAFPITYTDNEVPDSVMIGIANSNPSGNDDPLTTSVVTVDNISFAGTTVNVPNAGFEDWETVLAEQLDAWTVAGDEYPFDPFPSSVAKTTDRQHGNYAVQIRNLFQQDSMVGRLQVGPRQNFHGPAFPVYARHEELHCHLKYFPENNDTAGVSVELYKNGQVIGTAYIYIGDTVADYTHFSAPIAYHTDTNGIMIPDSAYMEIRSGTSEPDGPPRGASVLYIDNISFDNFYKTKFNANAGDNIYICPGDSVTIGGNPAADGGALPYTYAWSPAATLSDTTAENPIASPVGVITYHLTVTDANGTTATDEVTVNAQACPGIKDAGTQQKELQIYPNPARDKIYISVSGNEKEMVTVTLFDLSGKKIQESRMSCTSGQCGFLNLEHKQGGWYLLTVQGKRFFDTKKVVVIR